MYVMVFVSEDFEVEVHGLFNTEHDAAEWQTRQDDPDSYGWRICPVNSVTD